ncbi:MAG: SMP-30/gluconolactonase/LRE family protein [Halanaerobiales bacterium]
MQKKARLVLDERAILGEGPSWDEKTERLFWVDISGEKVHIYNPADNSNETIELERPVGAVVPREEGGAVVALGDGFYFLNLETGETENIVRVEENEPDTRFNDGKCDPAGRFWAGTMVTGGDKPIGNLYCLDTDLTVRKMVENVTISNGLAWSPDNTTMYYIDTPTGQVVAYDYDLESGAIDNKRVVVSIPENSGNPDGMNIDAQGMIWVAHWQGYQVSRWNPETGEKLAEIKLPVERVTSCCFAGKELTDLYITTAKAGLKKEELEKQPNAGSLFKVNTGIKGSKTYQFKG